jgi:hypothetical protein
MSVITQIPPTRWCPRLQNPAPGPVRSTFGPRSGTLNWFARKGSERLRAARRARRPVSPCRRWPPPLEPPAQVMSEDEIHAVRLGPGPPDSSILVTYQRRQLIPHCPVPFPDRGWSRDERCGCRRCSPGCLAGARAVRVARRLGWAGDLAALIAISPGLSSAAGSPACTRPLSSRFGAL